MEQNDTNLVPADEFVGLATTEELPDVLVSLAQRLLFGTAWETVAKNDPVAMLRRLDFLTDLPLVCRTEDCPYYAKCPIMRALPKERQVELQGQDCRYEKLYGIETFADWVRTLNLEPHDTPDILSVTKLIRNLIYLKRIDMQIAVEMMTVWEPRGYDKASQQTIEAFVAHPLLHVKERLEKQIDTIMSNLMVTRDKRFEQAERMRARKDSLDDLWSRARKVETFQTVDPVKNDG